ncbi:hypothetical protein FB107DRAFT_259275 [Schizophyllum commune]
MEHMTDEEERIASTLFPVVHPAERAYSLIYDISRSMEDLYAIFGRRCYQPDSSLATNLAQFGLLVARYVMDTSTALYSIHSLFISLPDSVTGTPGSDALQTKLADVKARYDTVAETLDSLALRSSQAMEALDNLREQIRTTLPHIYPIRALASYFLGADWCSREIALQKAPVALDKMEGFIVEHGDLVRLLRSIIEEERGRFSVQALKAILDLPLERRRAVKRFIINYIAYLDEWATFAKHEAGYLRIPASHPERW